MFFHLAFHSSGSYVSQFKLDATTFCNMNTNYFMISFKSFTMKGY